MKTVFFALAALVTTSNVAYAQTAATHCTINERTLFSCVLKKNKIVSVCASKDLSPTHGYMQYRFGKPGKVEMAIPRSTKGLPDFYLVASKDTHAEYNELAISNGPYKYSITSYRQAGSNSDSLLVDDSRKSMKDGNIVFSDDCASPAVPVNSAAISRLTGKSVDKGGF